MQCDPVKLWQASEINLLLFPCLDSLQRQETILFAKEHDPDSHGTL